jgi:hypothetical protein
VFGSKSWQKIIFSVWIGAGVAFSGVRSRTQCNETSHSLNAVEKLAIVRYNLSDDVKMEVVQILSM